jgi:4-amino-4-deoxy-L-arabinose transferase-like glycosyltransferase
MSRRVWMAAVVAIFAVGVTLRVLWLRADPPVTSVGIVWHDEGAWTHNARNLALWGTAKTDNWNPIYIAPVFTALEYGSFALFGVGTWQARVVPVASGLAAIIFLMAGLNALGGRRAAAVGGILLATNYWFVMWNRAALMESTMTAFIVAGWAAYAMSERRPWWAVVAGVCAALAFFTKAAAAFFVAAIALDALVSLSQRGRGSFYGFRTTSPGPFALAGLAVAFGIATIFVIPEWSEYYRYNWLTAVERKPSYTMAALIERASWLPVAQDFFSRIWLVVLGASIGLVSIVSRGLGARPGERLLVLWFLIGLAELVTHDSGNARRYVMFIPALIALASLAVTSDRPWVGADFARASRTTRWLAVPLVLLLAYIVLGSLIRVPFAAEAEARIYRTIVRSATAGAVVLAILLVWRWSGVIGWLSRARVTSSVLAGLLVLSLAWNGGQYAQWVARRTDLNYRASVAVGQALPAGALVHGKLANGLALENRIRPIFVGRGFGNYEDRLRREDVGYILTYVLPSVGYESQAGSGLIQEILDQYADRRVIGEFEVQETPGPDRAQLIQKHGRARD